MTDELKFAEEQPLNWKGFIFGLIYTKKGNKLLFLLLCVIAYFILND